MQELPLPNHIDLAPHSLYILPVLIPRQHQLLPSTNILHSLHICLFIPKNIYKWEVGNILRLYYSYDFGVEGIGGVDVGSELDVVAGLVDEVLEFELVYDSMG